MRGTWTVVTLPKDLRRFGHNLSPPSPIRAIPICGSTSTKGIDYETVDLGDNAEALVEVKALGYMQAPVVITDEDHWSGFRPDKIDELAQRLA